MQFEGADIAVLLTDPDAHRAALLARVAHPERIRLRPARWTAARLEDVHREVLTTAPPGSVRSHGVGVQAVHVQLQAGEASLAADLHHRFGDVLALRLGPHPYPLETAPRIARRPPEATIEAPGLRVTTHPERASYRAGEPIRGSVEIRNDGAEIHLSTGSGADGVLLDRDGPVVGVSSLPHRGTGRRFTLGPGESRRLALRAASETTDPRVGAVLAPGVYSLVVSVRLRIDGPAAEEGVLVTAPVDLVITEDDDGLSPRPDARTASGQRTRPRDPA